MHPALRRGALALLACALLAAPPLRPLLEASMTLQMLMQIPLLVAIGWWLAGALPRRAADAVADWNTGGVTGLVLASMVALLWMLPRALDAAVDIRWVAAAKFVSVPLLIGLPLGLSWPRMGFVVRGVFFMEFVATCFRLGWLYLASPDRLCSNYLLDDQQRLGRLLLVIGAEVLLLLMAKLLFGRFRFDDGAHEAPAPPAGAPHTAPHLPGKPTRRGH
ncbi:MAG: Cytochrome c oxidase associated membrane protein [Burkholderiaceae bacterium]|jgi:hypothetical protein|nr:MAG: Cytochrome c oxidase associated membrane protein [Burkholderiaceae bacterium]